jgi:phage anti-repressor protein
MIDINDNIIKGDDIINLLKDACKTKYNQWFERKIKYADLIKNIDYTKGLKDSTGGRPGIEYKFTVPATLKLLLTEISKNKKALELYRWLSAKYGKEIFVEPRSRDELIFSKMINEIFPIKFKEQVYIGKYRVDFIHDDLIIEYDEDHHEYQKKEDKKREMEITHRLKQDRSFLIDEPYVSEITFIRVKKGDELKGIREIMEYLIKNQILSLNAVGELHISDYHIEKEKRAFINEVITGQVNMDFYNLTREELIDKIRKVN